VIINKVEKADTTNKVVMAKSIYCEHNAEGCFWEGKVIEYKKHLQRCSFHQPLGEPEFKSKEEIVKCIYQECLIETRDLKTHLKDFSEIHQQFFYKEFKAFQEEVVMKLNEFDKMLSRKRSPPEKLPEVTKKVDLNMLSPRNKLPYVPNFKSPQKKNTKPFQVQIVERTKPAPENKYIMTPLRSKKGIEIQRSFHMNAKEHSAYVTFCGKRVKVEKGADEKFRFAFADANLNFSSWKWRVRILKFEQWIALGACLKDEIIAGNYKYTKPFHHSTFVFTSNGYTWNCVNADENSNYVEGMTFEEGDIIDFYYDANNQELQCSLNGKAFRLTKVKAGLMNFMVPCVIFQNQGDEVEFLECLS
jgi:hypothetical protein